MIPKVELLFCGMVLYLLVPGQQDHSMVFWAFLAPLLLFFFMGRREGLLWTSLLGVGAALFFFWYGRGGGYAPMFVARFMIAFGLITIVTYSYEFFRESHRQEMAAKNDRLEREVEERRKIETSLRESEARYRAIYHQAVEGILLVNRQGDIEDCNPQILQMLGYGREQMVGRNIFSIIHPDNLKKIPSQLDRLLAGETILVERQLRTVSGMYVYCEQSGRMISDDLIILLYRDITERKIAELALEKANQALEKLANIDGLTGVANRRRFDTVMLREWQRMARENKPLGLILCDIDYFKQFNDIYGHQAGDDCLIRVANILKNGVHRPADLVARYGGEEFVILLPDTGLKGCQGLAEKLRRRVEELGLVHKGSKTAKTLTISCGYASLMPGRGVGLERLVSLADQALYRAKEIGRNTVFGEEEETAKV